MKRKVILPSLPGSPNYLPRVLSMGPLSLDYNLTLTDEDMSKFNITDITAVKSLEDLAFLIDNKYMWSKVFIKTNNLMLNTLLYMNKVSDNKIYLEYISYCSLTLDDTLKDYQEMLTTINEFHILFINETSLGLSTPQVTFTLHHKDKSQTLNINVIQTYHDKEEKDNNNNNKSSSNNNTNNKVSNESSPLNLIELTCKQYDYFICDITHALMLNPFDDFVEFITYLKVKCNSSIIIKYNDISNKFPDKNSMITLNKTYLLTDTFIIDTLSIAVNNFNSHYQTFSTNKSATKQIETKNVIDYFITTIACGGQISMISSKVLFVFDDSFLKFHIIEVPLNTKALQLVYDIKPYPKINHSNVDQVEQYKSVLKDNAEYFKSIFYGGLLSRYLFSVIKNKSVDHLYPSYLTGVSILKRILELEVNKTPYPLNNKFYIVRLNKNEIEKYVSNYYMSKKEGKFVLDCINYEKSKMKYYVPLYDYNLHGYFKSTQVQKELKMKGFINSKGFVNYDPVYKEEMFSKKKKLPKNVQKNARDILKEQIENSKLYENKKVLCSVEPTIKKLPVENCEVTEKVEKTKCKHRVGKRRGSGKCNYCVLSEKAKMLEGIEHEKRKKMQLRRYDT